MSEEQIVEAALLEQHSLRAGKLKYIDPFLIVKNKIVGFNTLTFY